MISRLPPQLWVVTSYVNPDTDGVSCATAISEFLNKAGGSATLAFEGRINAETRWLRELSGSNTSLTTSAGISGTPVILVDTHHPEILPNFVDLAAVRLIIDHHPDGSPGSFPNATIFNEPVGAACTLVTEMIRSNGDEISFSSALMLAGGIVSNTLGFKAPSTTDRDRAAFDWLIPTRIERQRLISSLESARGSILRNEAAEVMTSDLKIITNRDGNPMAVVGQIELPGGRDLIVDGVVDAALRSLVSRFPDLWVVINVVDVTAEVSFLSGNDADLIAQIAHYLGGTALGQCAEVPRIVIRKTDIVPALKAIGNARNA